MVGLVIGVAILLATFGAKGIAIAVAIICIFLGNEQRG